MAERSPLLNIEKAHNLESGVLTNLNSFVNRLRDNPTTQFFIRSIFSLRRLSQTWGRSVLTLLVPQYMLAEMHFALRFGQRVDTYLDTQGALAQAVDRNTFLVSSNVFGMNLPDRRLVLLHELAHLEQLAKPGNDPTRLLESEAWEAAHAWVAGRRYRIRGRARGRLNALAIIQGGPKGHPHAPIWYHTSPVEPIGNKSSVSVEDVTVLEKITLDSILDTIIASKKTTEVVLVSHGSGSGLAIPLLQGSTAGAERSVILVLSADRPGEEVGFDGTKMKTPTKSDKDVAELTRLAEQQVKALRAKMNQVRSMKLKHVAFRACSMGISKDSLQAFRNLFGAESVSAPKEFDSYGNFSPSIGGDVEAWAKAKRKDGYHISIDGQVAFGVKATDSPLVYTIVSRADSKDAFRAWVRTHIVDGGWGPKGVFYHGMMALHPASPTSPIIYFVRDADFVSRIVHYSG